MSFAVGLHALLRLLDLRLLGLEPARFLRRQRAARDTLVDALFLVLHALLDAGIVGAVSLGLAVRPLPRNKKCKTCNECELENDCTRIPRSLLRGKQPSITENPLP